MARTKPGAKVPRKNPTAKKATPKNNIQQMPGSCYPLPSTDIRKNILRDDLPSPTEADMNNPYFKEIFQVIKDWDIKVPGQNGYTSGNGSHALLILHEMNVQGLAMNNNPNGRGGLSPEAEILTILRGLSQEEQIERLCFVLKEINIDFQTRIGATSDELARMQKAYEGFKSLDKFLVS